MAGAVEPSVGLCGGGVGGAAKDEPASLFISDCSGHSEESESATVSNLPSLVYLWVDGNVVDAS